ncbi:MAG: Zn-ribbon domain-containing OB-fold protein [Natronomonas sp.]
MTDLPTPTPDVNPETEPFWDATGDGQLLIQRCGECDRIYYYPRARCPDCAADTTEWMEASGRGEIYSYTITHGGVGHPYAEATPFVLAYVELEEGPRVLTNIVCAGLEDGADPLSVGQSVEVVFDDTDDEDDDYALPRFTPR